MEMALSVSFGVEARDEGARTEPDSFASQQPVKQRRCDVARRVVRYMILTILPHQVQRYKYSSAPAYNSIRSASSQTSALVAFFPCSVWYTAHPCKPAATGSAKNRTNRNKVRTVYAPPFPLGATVSAFLCERQSRSGLGSMQAHLQREHHFNTTISLQTATRLRPKALFRPSAEQLFGPIYALPNSLLDPVW